MSSDRLIHDQSWRSARAVAHFVQSRFGDEELIDVFHAVREIIAEGLGEYTEQMQRQSWRVNRRNSEVES